MRNRPDEDHELLCDLTPDELHLKGEQLAEAVDAHKRTEDDKARFTMLTLKDEILSKQERRQVPCRWYVETSDSGMEMWVLRRTDTWRVLQTQPVTSADRQLELIQGGAN